MINTPIEFIKALPTPPAFTYVNKEIANIVARHDLLTWIDDSNPAYLRLRTTARSDDMTVAISTHREDLLEIAESYGIPVVEHALIDLIP